MKHRASRRLVVLFSVTAVLAVAVAVPTSLSASSPGAARPPEARDSPSASDSGSWLRFVHRGTSSDTFSYLTYVEHFFMWPYNSDQILLVTQNISAYGGSDAYNPHSTAVWWDEGGLHGWTVRNLDEADMPEGVGFNVLLPDSSKVSGVHEATSANMFFGTTRISHPLANDNPNAIVLVTQIIWTGPAWVVNDHPVGVAYDEPSGRWAIFNQDGANIPDGALFNILIATADTGAFVHQASVANTTLDETLIDHPLANSDPHAILFVTQNKNPGGGLPGMLNDHEIAVKYDEGAGKWAIVNQDGASIPDGAAFNVVIPHTQTEFLVHEATAANTILHTTYLSDPLIEDSPEAYLFVTPNWNPGGMGGTYNNHVIGARYSALQWAIFNQDDLAIILGAAFNVLIPSVDAGVFLHNAWDHNTVDVSTYIDHPLTNEEPSAIVFITQNLNPGGGGGTTYNDHPTAVWYDTGEEKWAIRHQSDVVPVMPESAAFNVIVPVSGDHVFVHEATPANTLNNWTTLNHPLTNDNPNAIVLVTQRVTPGGGAGKFNDHPLGVYYYSPPGGGRWAIFNQDGEDMPVGATFNVMVGSSMKRLYLPVVMRLH